MTLRDKLKFWILLSSYIEMIVRGTSPLSLPDAIANSLEYLKAFGGTEQRNLPSGYTQVEYLESDGNQYIDTGVVLKSEATITTVAQANTFSGTGPSSFWGFMGGGSSLPRWGWSIYSSRWLTDLNTTSNIGTADTNKHTFVNTCYYNNNVLEYDSLLDGNSVFVSGRPVGSLEAYTSNTLSAYLFARNNNGTAGNFLSCRIFSYEIAQDGVKVLSLIPCRRNSDSVLGMYDTVSGTFLTNGGTGTFTAGPDAVPTPDTPMDIISNNGVLKVRNLRRLPSGYKEVEYLESTGEEYIDLGYALDTSTDDIEIEIQLLQIESQTNFFGARGSTVQRVYTLASYGEYWRWGWKNNSSVSNVTADLNKHVLRTDHTNNTLSLDGTVIETKGIGSANTVTPTTATLFAIHATSGSDYYFSALKVFGYKKWTNGVLAQNLVPCRRKSDNVLGMYDLVTDTFFTNAAETGAFIAGADMPDYEIYTDGTVETINVHSKNLFDKEQTYIPVYINTNTGVITGASGNQRSFVVGCLPNTTYTLSGMTAASGWGSFTSSAIGTTATSFTAGNGTITTGANDKYLIGMAYVEGGSIYDYRDTLQIEQGSTATDYQPYFDGGTATAEMLLKVGNYQDVQEILSGAITRNVGVKVLDGTEDWQNISGYMSIAKTDLGTNSTVLPASSKSIFCTHFQVKTGTFVDGIGVGNSYVNFKYDSLFTTLTQWTQYLADQYANGTPVIIVYPLATPTTESVAGQALQVTDGDNVVEITQAAIDGLELEAKFKKGA